ncbi:hypothetical protein QW71_15815 [Paenibacillus sp. IHB B 3415]|nr:hypothetical protein QW71_15815 [Paenibacillus sp. IHB B 3415]
MVYCILVKMLYILQLGFNRYQDIRRIVAGNTAIVWIIRLNEVECCILYNNFGFRRDCRREILYFVQDLELVQ